MLRRIYFDAIYARKTTSRWRVAYTISGNSGKDGRKKKKEVIGVDYNFLRHVGVGDTGISLLPGKEKVGEASDSP